MDITVGDVLPGSTEVTMDETSGRIEITSIAKDILGDKFVILRHLERLVNTCVHIYTYTYAYMYIHIHYICMYIHLKRLVNT